MSRTKERKILFDITTSAIPGSRPLSPVEDDQRPGFLVRQLTTITERPGLPKSPEISATFARMEVLAMTGQTGPFCLQLIVDDRSRWLD